MRALKVLYPNMIHVTCAAHGLHRVAEFIRDQYDHVNKLISEVKKVLTKVNQKYCIEGSSNLKFRCCFLLFYHRLHDENFFSKHCFRT